MKITVNNYGLFLTDTWRVRVGDYKVQSVDPFLEGGFVVITLLSKPLSALFSTVQRAAHLDMVHSTQPAFFYCSSLKA